MIRKLKRRFIILALTSLFLLLAMIVVGMNWLNYKSVISEADETLGLISENRGEFPVSTTGGRSAEIAFESRYFSMLVNPKTGDVVQTNLAQIYAVGVNTAIRYTEEVLSDNKYEGFVEDYRFKVNWEEGFVRVTFLDLGRKLEQFRDSLLFSIFASLAGYLITAIIICVLAGHFVRPVAESYERQKRFITDAGHEIKTPLTIISANVDVLAMDIGENESLTDIRDQTKRLAGLTNDLVYLARMEEAQDTMPMVDFPVSEVVADTAGPFATLAQSQHKALSLQIEPMLTMCGNDKAISRLVSIMLDNAIKYSPEESAVVLQLGKQGRHIQLTVSNISSVPIDSENLKHVFERFYRMDASRNSATGGHGIGLSMARAIVENHGGKISAATPDGSTFMINAMLPA